MDVQRGRLPLLLVALLLALTICTGALRAQAPTSVWWYPDGTPEAVGSNLAQTDTGQTDDLLVVRWRTTALRGASTILVGAIRSRTSSQEIVGMMEDTLVILSADGVTLLRLSYRSRSYFPNEARFQLTGLFNPAQPTFTGDRPRYIGVGVERQQTNAGNDSLWAFLADSTGEARIKIAIARIGDSVTIPGNRIAGIYPAGGYSSGGQRWTPVVVSQDHWTPGSSAPVPLNSFRLYNVATSLPFDIASLRTSYPVAPRTYPHVPSLFYDNRGGETWSFGLATAPYASSVVVTPDTAPPLRGVQTRSDEMYSIALRDSNVTLRHLATQKMPPDSPARPGGSTRSYVVTLTTSPTTTGVFYRLIAENHSPTDAGTPQLRLVQLEGDSVFGRITNGRANHGWQIVAADLDGSESNTGGGASGYPNNTAEEILTAYSQPGDPDIPNNTLRLFRLNEIDRPTSGSPLALHEVLSQEFSGRLMCAGDLATDIYNRREIVVADSARLTIIRLIPYAESRFGGGGRYFETVRTFDLDSRVLDCAIADIDGDRENELIAVTEQATYAIGLRHPQPFPSVAADTTTLCIGDSTAVRWQRRVGGGEEGVTLSLAGSSGQFQLGRRDTSMVGLDSFVVHTAGLPAGLYTLRIADSLVPSVENTALHFTVLASTISAPAASISSTTLDSSIRLASQTVCPDQPLLLRSIEGGPWDTLAPPPLIGDSVIATTSIPCTPALACLDRDSVLVTFKFADPTRASESAPVPVIIRLPRLPLVLEPGDTSRSRTREIRWRRGDFDSACPTLELSLSPDSGRTWRSLGTLPADRERLSLTVADEIEAKGVRLRLCCAGNATPGCAVASVEFEIEPPATANYIAPNPFNPLRGTARIVYRLNRPGRATLTILDAGRGVVTRLTDETGGGEAGRRSLVWDGRTSRGGIVATGSYICVVESDNGESILIPFYVMQR